MTVDDLIEVLVAMPQDATVKIAYEATSRENLHVVLDDDGCVYIEEINPYGGAA